MLAYAARNEARHYHQYLGLFDAFSQLNAWGHWPDCWQPIWHSTNLVFHARDIFADRTLIGALAAATSARIKTMGPEAGAHPSMQ